LGADDLYLVPQRSNVYFFHNRHIKFSYFGFNFFISNLLRFILRNILNFKYGFYCTIILMTMIFITFYFMLYLKMQQIP
jgi:hypothetical protein